MKTRQPKPTEPSPLDKLSINLTKALEADFALYGNETVERLRESHPDVYVQLCARLIASRESKSDGFESCNSHEEIGRKLLQSIGFAEPDDASIQRAVEANNIFIDGLQRIYQQAQGQMQ
jgi:hypothetical protein